MPHLSRPHIIIIGGNFAGLSTARALSAHHSRVTVIDPNPDVEWLPHIHELISRAKKADQLRHSRADLVERAGHTFIQDSVIAINSQLQQVHLANGSSLSYDDLVVAIGNVSLIDQIKGARDYALPFGSIAEAERVALQLQRLDSLSLPERPIVLVGANIEGLEIIGEMMRRYKRQWRFQLHIIEQNEQLMPHFKGMDSYLREKTAHLAIHWHTGRKVVEVTKDSVLLDNGEKLSSRVTLWCAGARPHSLLHSAGLANLGQYAPVRPTLQSLHHDHIWLAGDTVAFPQPLDKQAYHALPMGALIAKNLKRQRQHRPLQEFKPLPIPSLMSFGDIGFLLFKSHAIASPSLLAAKEGVFQAGFNCLKLPQKRDDWQQLKLNLRFSVSNMSKLAKTVWQEGSLLHARRFDAQ